MTDREVGDWSVARGVTPSTLLSAGPLLVAFSPFSCCLLRLIEPPELPELPELPDLADLVEPAPSPSAEPMLRRGGRRPLFLADPAEDPGASASAFSDRLSSRPPPASAASASSAASPLPSDVDRARRFTFALGEPRGINVCATRGTVLHEGDGGDAAAVVGGASAEEDGGSTERFLRGDSLSRREVICRRFERGQCACV